MTPDTHAGACLCGAIGFEFDTPSLWSAHCHCSLCRRAHGAAFVTWVGVEEARFRFTTSDSLHWFNSSTKGKRGFCTQCGSTLFFKSTASPDEIHIARANIAGDLDIQPSIHVSYGSEEVSWFPFTDDLPHKHDSN